MGHSMIEVAVTTNVECAHRDDIGRVHGHSYTVEVWFPAGACMVTLRRFVSDVAQVVDHSMLEESIGSSRMEDLASWLLCKVPNASRVIVRRPTLGFAAQATR